MKEGPMKAVIFDLDGTLADTALDLMLAGNATFKEIGLEYQLEKNRDEGIASGGGKSTIRHGLKQALGEVKEERVQELYPTFLRNYEKVIAVNSRLYDGMLECLQNLLELDFLLGVCTNKPTKQACILLDILGVTNYFEAIVGPDTFGEAKPKPRSLHGVIEMIGVETKCSILVGDTETDFLTSEAAGIPFVLTTYGHGVQYQGFDSSCTPYLAARPKDILPLATKILKKC